MLDGKRQAAIVGINEYGDPNIPNLKGALNDATEVCQRLKDLGGFEVSDRHLLVDSQATCEAIRRAISDLFWQTDPCDLAVFYFSGHGFVDGRGYGYIAPCNMKRDEPLVCGINMLELKQILLHSVNKVSVLMLLDCCYSGIPTRGEKAIAGVKAPYGEYFGNLAEERGGEGKFILASSDADQVSREIGDCKHVNGESPHPHGRFTFHLIEALDGKASDETGIITLNGLLEYVGGQMESIGKQRPSFFAADAGRTSQIRIASSREKNEEYVRNALQEAKEDYTQDDPVLLMLAADKVHNVLNVSPKNAKGLHLKNEINTALVKYFEKVSGWLLQNEFTLKPVTLSIWGELEGLVAYLSFDRIVTLDRRKRILLANLCKISLGRIQVEYFRAMCNQYSTPPSTPKAVTGGNQ